MYCINCTSRILRLFLPSSISLPSVQRPLTYFHPRRLAPLSTIPTYSRLATQLQQRKQSSLASADVLTDDDYVPFIYPTNTVLPVSKGLHSGWPPPLPVGLAVEAGEPDIEIVESELGGWWGEIEAEGAWGGWEEILEASEESTEGVGDATEGLVEGKKPGGGTLREGGKRPTILAKKAKKSAAAEKKRLETAAAEIAQEGGLNKMELELEKPVGIPRFEDEPLKKSKKASPRKNPERTPRAKKLTRGSEKRPYQKKYAQKSSEKQSFVKRSTEQPRDEEKISPRTLKPERRSRDVWHLPPVNSSVELTPLQQYVSSRPRNTIERWRVEKARLQAKFGNAHWNPWKKLSPEAQDAIRVLHRDHPEYSTEKLADKFEISPEAIKRILKSKWRATASKAAIQETQDRWKKREGRVWERWVEMGVVRTKKMKKVEKREMEARIVGKVIREGSGESWDKGSDVESGVEVDNVPMVNLGKLSGRLV